jgi:hypothetical protein
MFENTKGLTKWGYVQVQICDQRLPRWEASGNTVSPWGVKHIILDNMHRQEQLARCFK